MDGKIPYTMTGPQRKGILGFIRKAFAEALGGHQCTPQETKQRPCRLCDSGAWEANESVEFLV